MTDMDDLIKRLRDTGATRAKATAHDDPSNYLLVVAKLSHEDAALMTEAAAALAEAQARVDKLEAWAARQNEVIDNAVAERTEELRSELGHTAELLAEAQAEIVRLRGLIPNADETPDEILWRDYMRGVHPDLLAKQRKVTRERMRHMLQKISHCRAALEKATEAP